MVKRGNVGGFSNPRGVPSQKRLPNPGRFPNSNNPKTPSRLPNLPKPGKGMSKSTKIALIIVGAIMLILIIFLIVRGINKGSEKENELNKFTSDLEISQVQITGYNDVSVKLSGSADEEDVDSVNIIIYDDDNKVITQRRVSMQELQDNDFEVDLRITNTSRIKEVSITPTFLSESGGKVGGKVEDTYEVPESSKTIFSPEGENTVNEETNNTPQGTFLCTDNAQCNDHNNCTTDECSYGGKCIHSLIENCFSCTSVLQCDDGNTCTTNVCSGGRCAYISVPGCVPCGDSYQCEDDNACTENLCVQGRCLSKPIEGCKTCTFDSECEDDNACTDNFCINNACSNPFISNCVSCTSVSECNDNISCTTDTCSGDKCVYTEITSCISNDGCCPSGCNYDNDKDCSPVCNNGVIEGTEKCDGSNLNGATCASVRGSEYDGTLKCTNFCTFDTSSCKLACSCPDDGNACTTDSCINNVCQHTPVSNANCCNSDNQCNDNNECTKNSCVNNVCVTTNLVGVPCSSDDNVCTNDVCSNGQCSHGPLTGTPCLSDDNACTTDVCSSLGQCAHNALTGIQCASDNDPCTTDVCSSNGYCSHTQITSCSRTSNDGCCPAGCTYLNDLNCVQCTSSNQASVCNDNDVCTKDSCVGGTCSNSRISNCCTSDIQCNDNDICTTDSCSASNACIHTSIINCCTSSSQCGENQICDVNNHCVTTQTSGCTGSGTRSCTITNGVGIQTRTCNSGTWSSWGTCTVVSCNSGYTKSGNTCVASTPTCSCPSDNNVCTEDICQNNVCMHISINGCCVSSSDCISGQTCTNNQCTIPASTPGDSEIFVTGGTKVILPKTGITASELGVIVDDNNPLSVQIADYYVTARGIPASNVVHIRIPSNTQEFMSSSDFATIKQQVDSALQGTGVQALALTWLKPYGVGQMSITTAFAMGYRSISSSNTCNDNNAKSGTTNPYSNNYDSVSPWTDLQFRPTMTIAASTFADAKALIDRGISADKTFPSGTAYMLVTSDSLRSKRCTGSGNECQALVNSWDISNSGIAAVLMNSESLSNRKDVLFYFTGLESVPNLATNSYPPGAIGDSLTSCAGMLTNPCAGQMSSVEWLRNGLTASSGTVVEPCALVEKFPNPSIVVPQYFRGNTLIEAYWKSVLWPAEGIFVGEPLAKPFGNRVSVSGGTLTIETTWLKPGVTYVLEAADSESGPFTSVQSGITVSSYQKKTFTVSSPLRNVYRLREGQPASSTCNNECSSSELRRCSGTSAYQVCGNYDSDSCLEWSSITNCASGQTCNSATGQCVTNTPTCTSHSSSACYNGDVYWYDSCGTREGIRYDCTSSQTCSNGQCITSSPSCTNECSSSGLKQCTGQNAYQTCGNYDSDSCLEWGSTTICPNSGTCSGAGVCSSGSGGGTTSTLKYYGVDRGNPISDANYQLLSQRDGLKVIVVDTDIRGGTSEWQNILNLAEKYDFYIVIWPSDWSNHDSNWPNCGWETPYLKNPGSSGDRIVNVKPMLDYMAGNPRVIGIVNAHEPFWSCIASINEMADIKTQLKSYVMNKFGRDIQVWNYVDNIAENRISSSDINRIMDVAVTWQHCFGGAEGTCPQAKQKILNDRAAIHNAGLDGKVDLVYLFQTFAMGSGYRMPTATEMYDTSCDFLDTGALDGFMWYTWGACWYDSDLYCPASTHPNQNLWPVMDNVYNDCIATGAATNTCTESDWSYTNGACQPSNTLTRTWTKLTSCTGGVTHPSTETISCTYTDTGGSFSFVVFTDTHGEWSILTSLMTKAKALNPAFGFFTGDSVDTGVDASTISSWKNAVSVMNPITFGVRGNHDNLLTGSLTSWSNNFDFSAVAASIGATHFSTMPGYEDETYSFDYGNSHFIGVDVPGEINQLSSAEVSWIDSDLTSAENRGMVNAFIFNHGSIYCMDKGIHCSCGTSRTCYGNNNGLINVLNKHPIFAADFAGHEHIASIALIDNTRISSVTSPFYQFISGTAGGDVGSARGCSANRYDYCEVNRGFNYVTVNGNQITVKWYRDGSSVTHTTTFTSTPSCTSHSSSECYNGDVYWYDSCGTREGIRTDCTSSQTCSNGQCITNSPSCTNECSSSGLKQCTGQNAYQTCGNYDSDSCLEWGSTTVCPNSGTCSGAGVCSSTTPTPSGTIYYVSTSGSDSGSGTSQSAPWKTLQYAETHATAPGSVIALKKGDNWASATAFGIHHGGTPEKPITWDGGLWGTGANAIISNTKNRGENDPASIVTIANCDNVVFQNIIIDGNNHYAFTGLSLGGNPYQASGLSQNDESNIVVQNCEVRNIGGSYANCLMAQTWKNDMYDIKIQNNYVHDCSTWCIGFYMGKQMDGATPATVHNLYIGYNTITNCQKTSGQDDGPGIGVSGGVDVGVVEYNTITQGSSKPPSGIEVAGDPVSLKAPKDLKVRYNDVKMNNVPSYVSQNGGPQQIEIYSNSFYTASPGDQATVIIYNNGGSYAGASFNFHDNTIGSNGGLCFADQTGKATFSSNNKLEGCK